MVESSIQSKYITEYDFDVAEVYAYLNKIFDERIVVLDGGMGTQIQTYKLEEEDYRGKYPGFSDFKVLACINLVYYQPQF